MQSASTIKQYTYYVNKFSFFDLNKVDEVYTTLKNMKSKKTQKSMSNSNMKIIISAFMWQLKKDKAEPEIIEKYKSYLEKMRKEMSCIENDNKTTHGIIPKWLDIIKLRDALDDNSKNKVILSLYTMIPPRRLQDYVQLKIVDNEKNMTDKKYNYYHISDKCIIFNSYKTERIYKMQCVDIPQNLCKVIDDYIKIYKLESGDLLLNFNNYRQLYYVLYSLIGCGVDNIRHSYVNYQYEKYNMPPSKDIEQMAHDMGHSVTTNLRYRKNI